MQTNVFCNIDDDESCDHNNEDRFEEQKGTSIDTMVQNTLSSEQIYDYFENVVTMAPCQDFKSLGLFKIPIVKN
jgi:hypothetical protein